MKPKKKNVFVALSGGVDSSVAAALLLEQGYNVIGCHMKCYNVDGCAEQDAHDARRVTEQLGIPFYTFDFEREYKKRVVEYMIRGYRAGNTPNPDVMCNKEIKFGLFLTRALELGADFVATGHYVKLKQKDKKYSLYAAKDKNKDQSYFLWTLTQKEFKHCIFPLGGITKPKVRVIAKKIGLVTAAKKDSQGICFLGKVLASAFLKNYIPAREGAIITSEGREIGKHDGAAFYTIGQRHGLKVGGQKEPLYVVSKDVIKNTVTVAEGKNNPALYRTEAILTDMNFINPKSIIMNHESVYARLRYRQPLFTAFLYKLPALEVRRGKKTANYKLIFDAPQKSAAKGQSAVFYTKKGEMLGGGVIL